MQHGRPRTKVRKCQGQVPDLQWMLNLYYTMIKTYLEVYLFAKTVKSRF